MDFFGSGMLIVIFWCVLALVTCAGLLVVAVMLKRQIREQKVNRRVCAQAKALGIWKMPQALGGKALEISARENFGIRRKRGETDLQLRRRCLDKKMAGIQKEITETSKREAAKAVMVGISEGEYLDRLALQRGIERKPGESDDMLRSRIREEIQRGGRR